MWTRRKLVALFVGLSLVGAGWIGRPADTSALSPLPDLTFERGTYDQASQKVRLYLINNGEVSSVACVVTLKALKLKKGTNDQETVKFEQTLPALKAGQRFTMIFDLPKSDEFSFSPLYANA